MGILQEVLTIANAQAQKKVYQRQAQYEERNAEVERQRGRVLKREGDVAVLDAIEDFDDISATVASQLRYNGFRADTGTNARVRLEQAKEFDKEITAQRYNIATGQMQAQEAAVQREMQAQVLREQGRQALFAGYTRAGTSLMKRASQAFMMA
jgi:hypothetical protein